MPVTHFPGTASARLQGKNLSAGYDGRSILSEIDFRAGPSAPTAANLKRVFDLDANIIRAPYSQRLMCVPILSDGATSPRVESGLAQR